MSDAMFDSIISEVDTFSYNQCVVLLEKLSEVLKNWTSKDSDSDELFYSKKNMEHLLRGASALAMGKGVEHELIEE